MHILYHFACTSLKGYLTDEPGCACEGVEPPHNVSKGWAAVVKYGSREHGDCNIDRKVHLSLIQSLIVLLDFVMCGLLYRYAYRYIL